MRRLEDVLHDLAEQDERLDTGELITRIERNLSGEGVLTVATTDGTSAMDAQENTRQDGRKMPILVAIGAAVLMLVAVGLPILMVGDGDSVVVVTPSTTVAPIVTTVPIAAGASMMWERIDNPVVFGGDRAQRMVAAAHGEGIVVAVGSDRSGGDRDAAIWYSFDGRVWSRVPHDEAVFGGDGHQAINGVAAVGSGFVAVGSEGDDPIPLEPSNEPSESFETHAAVWHSEDGITWSRAPHHEALSGRNGGVVMNDIAYDGTSLVAVGDEYHQAELFALYGWSDGDPAEVDTDVDAAVWRSDDGVSWIRVGNEGDVFGGDTVRHNMNAVVAGGPGFVAVGIEGFDYTGFAYWTPDGTGNQATELEEVTDNAAAVWTSPDGETWTRVDGAPSLSHSGGEVAGWAVMVDIVDTGSGLVAVGRDSWDPTPSLGWRQSAAAWRSVDGLSWRRTDEPGELGYARMRAVTDTGDGRLVAVGLWYGGFQEVTAYMWSSQDHGDTWIQNSGNDRALYGGIPESREEAEAFGPATIQAVTSLGGEAIAVGYMGDDAAVWIGTWSRGTDG